MNKKIRKSSQVGKRIICTWLLITPGMLSGCSSYSSSFSCGDAKGANCMSMDRVDRMISSGEIERFNEFRAKEGAKCRSDRCRSDQDSELMARKEQKSELVFLEGERLSAEGAFEKKGTRTINVSYTK